MEDNRKTKDQLQKELDNAHQRIAELEASAARWTQADQALHEYDARYRFLLENMHSGFSYCKMIFDQGGPTDFIYLEVNSAFETLTGLKNVIGKKVSEVIPGIQESDLEIFEILGRIVSTGKTEKFEIYLNSMRQWFSVTIYSPEKGFFVNIFDIVTENKRKDGEISKKNELLRMVGKMAKIGGWEFDALTYRGSRTDEVDRIYDLRRASESNVTKTIALYVGESRDRIERAVRESVELAKPYDLELELVSAKGVPKTVRVMGTPVMEQGKVVKVQGIIQDITERRQTEESLRLTQFCFDNASVGIHLIDADGRILKVNAAACRMLGYSRDELTAMTIFDIDPTLTPEIGESLLETVKKQKGVRLETVHRRKDGLELPVEINSNLFEYEGHAYCIVFIQNITERKQAEKQLRESEEKYRLIADNISDIIVIFDPVGTITFVSPSHQWVLGRGPEVIGSSAFGYVHPEDVPHVRELISEALKSREVMRSQCRYIAPSGDYIWLELEGKFINIKGENECLVVARNITARKQAEETLRKTRERLQQSHKMEAIGTLAGGIAHDFNNILSAVLGYAELARLSTGNREKLNNHLDEIIHAGIRARDLVRHILTFSRQANIRREPIEIVPLIKETLRFLRASLPVTIDIRQDFSVSDSIVVADPTQIHQIIMNLCTNAAHAMKDKGGLLTIRLTEVALGNEADLRLRDLKRGRYLKLTISDTGSGIPQKIINKIFDPFFTTKEREEGTGMGLSVVHGIIKDMGGAVSVYSDPGEGSIFHVFFPKYEGDAAKGDAAHTASEINHGKILFVDDEKHIITTGHEILEHLGYEVVSTTTPREALRLFESDPGAFDLVLTDMTMPGMTGLELSERIIAIRPEIPVVLCTGFDLGITEDRIRDAGIRSFVMKPMIAGELANAVLSALNRDKI